MDKQVQLGRDMWHILADTFRVVAQENDALTQGEKARVWAGFLAAASGAMACDLGKDDAQVVLTGVLEAVKIAPRQTNG